MVREADTSSDFTGGCTPYRDVAKNVAGKLKRANHKKKPIKLKSKKSETEHDMNKQLMDDKGRNLTVAWNQNEPGSKSCMFCSLSFTPTSYKDHLKDCMKNRFCRSTSLTKQDDVSGSESSVGLVSDEPHQSSTHLNDKVNPKLKEETGVKVIGKVLDCPLCGQALKTIRSRQVHIKRCAKKFEVSTSLLQKHVHQQAEEYRLKQEAGELPTETNQQKKPRQQRKRRVVGHISRNQPVRLDEPQSKFDEETQLAIALSESLREDNQLNTATKHALDVKLLPGIGADTGQKNAFSVLMTPKCDSDGPKKKNRKKQLSKGPYQLQMETVENRLRKLEDKIGQFLSSEECHEVYLTPRLPPSVLANSFHPASNHEVCGLWFIDSQPETDKMLFYVKQLQPQVIPSEVKAGSKLKQMSNIPGWKPLDIQNKTSLEISSHDESLQFFSTNSASQTLMASTQTAILLAGMASDTSELYTAPECEDVTVTHRYNNKGTPHKNVTFAVPDSDQNITHLKDVQEFCSSIEPKRKMVAREKLIEDFLKLLTSGEKADVFVTCRDGTKLKAHSLIIHTRCPTLSIDINNQVIDLTHHGQDCVQALLRYIYTGDLSVPVSIATELGDLAKRYDLVELCSVCNEITLENNISEELEEEAANADVQSHELIDRTLQNLLHDAWGSDSDTEDSDSLEMNGGFNNSCRDEKELELDELFVLASQQHRSPSLSDQDKTEDETGMNPPIQCGKDTSEASTSTTLSAALLQKLNSSFLQDTSEQEGDAKSDSDGAITCDATAKSGETGIEGASRNQDLILCVDEEGRILTVDIHQNNGRQSEDDYPETEHDTCDNDEHLKEVYSISSETQNKQTDYSPHHRHTEEMRRQNGTTPDLFGDSDGNESTEKFQDLSVMPIHVASSDDESHHSFTEVDEMKSNEDEANETTKCPNNSDQLDDDVKLPNVTENSSLRGDLPLVISEQESSQNNLDEKASGSISQGSPQWHNEHVPIVDICDKKRHRTSHSDSDDEDCERSQVPKKARQMAETWYEHFSDEIQKDRKHTNSASSSPSFITEVNSLWNVDEDFIDLTASDDKEQLILGEQQTAEGQPRKESLVEQLDASLNSTPTKQVHDKGFDDKHQIKDLETGLDLVDQSEYGATDVWDDFDDAGSYQGFDFPLTQVARRQSVTCGEVPRIRTQECNEYDDVHLHNKEEDESLVISLNNESHVSLVREEKPELTGGSTEPCLNREMPQRITSPFKTPIKGSSLTNNPASDCRGDIHIETPADYSKKYQVRNHLIQPSPFTPMSDYDSMSTPELKKACHNVGVKPFPKKKMVAILKDIYHKTHSYETDTDYDGTPCRPSSRNSTENIHSKNTKKALLPKYDELEEAVVHGEDIRKADFTDDDEDGKVLRSGFDDDKDSLNSSQECNSQDSDLPEESLIIDDGEQDKKISKKDLAFKQQAIWEFIKSDQDLYLKILHYEPLDISMFHQQLKSSGLNVGVRIVMDFLDDQNVPFTMKNQPTNRGKRRKPRRGVTSSQQSTQSQQ